MKKLVISFIVLAVIGTAATVYADQERVSLKDYNGYQIYQQDIHTDYLLDG